MTALELTDQDKAALTAVLRAAIAADAFPMSARVRQLRAILDKLEPTPATAALPAPEAGRGAEPIAGTEEGATALEERIKRAARDERYETRSRL